MKHRTNQEHVQAVREGKDYYSPKLAVNETIDHLVDCALIVKNHDVPLTAETRALDAIGVQVARELKNRAQMIDALTDRLKVVEGERDLLQVELASLREVYDKERVAADPCTAGSCTGRKPHKRGDANCDVRVLPNTRQLKDYPEVQEQLAGAQFAG